MVDKLETAAKPADGAGLEKGDKGDKNPSLNLVDLKSDQPTKAPDTTAGKAQADSAMKGFPAVEMFDPQQGQDSPKKAANRSSLAEKDTPRQEGTSAWAQLEGFTLATEKPVSLKEHNRNSMSDRETPRFEGAGNWAKLEGHTLATDKPDSPKKAENRASFNEKEKPRYEGTGNW
ncbi:MAG: hypothetical protein C0508_02515 [Cyanobacteria bacterium PR.023]|nr:hypothetical protein [Cyanobacteria bacterium PR.023]